jgi:hypothetical protein
VSGAIQAQPRSFGAAGIVAGLLALIAVAMAQWVLPMVPAPRPLENTAVQKPLKDRVLEKLKLASPKKEEAKPLLEGWIQPLQTAAIGLAVLAIILAAIAVFRREERIYAGVAAALGISALALQLAILFAGVVVAILILYVVLGQHDGGLQPVTIVGGVVFVLAIVAAFAFGIASPMVVALMVCIAAVILAISSLLGGSW